MKELEKVKKEFSKNVATFNIRQISIDLINNKVKIVSALEENEFLSKLPANIDMSVLNLESRTPEIDYMIKYTINGHNYKIKDGYCTVGFAAKDSSGDPGFVTAGHCVALSGASKWTNIYYDGDHAGDVSTWKFQNGNVDAAFIKLRDPWIGTTWLPTRELEFGGDSYDYIGNFSSFYNVGQVVRFYGLYNDNSALTNTHVEFGNIVNSSVDVYDEYNVLLYTNMFVTDHTTHHGDSGGPAVVKLYIGEGYYEYDVIGVLSFSPDKDDESDPSRSYFSKAQDILNTLNLTAY